MLRGIVPAQQYRLVRSSVYPLGGCIVPAESSELGALEFLQELEGVGMENAHPH